MSNFVQILGTPVCEPVFSHEIYGESFYTFELLSRRLSGRTDLIPCMVSARLLEEVITGEAKVFSGQLRSYNKVADGKSRLDLRLFVKEISAEEAEESLNSVLLMGYICKEPVYRRTPFGREITDLLLAVNRAYNKSDYIPIITWGRTARETRDYSVGDKLRLTGRLQSREYEKMLEDGTKIRRTAYEVSVNELVCMLKE